MSGFAVVDLLRQEAAVRNHVQGWQVESVISWLENFDSIEPARTKVEGAPATYRFVASAGPQAVIFFRADGSFGVLPVDN